MHASMRKYMDTYLFGLIDETTVECVERLGMVGRINCKASG